MTAAWSRSGKLAYLTEDGNDRRPKLFVVDDGTTRSFALPFARADRVSWSRDGTRLAVEARKLPLSPYDVYSLDTDGRHLERVTTFLDTLGADWDA